MRARGGVLVAGLSVLSVLAALAACGTGPEVPTPEVLRAGLLIAEDLGGAWRTDTADLLPDGEHPTPFSEACAEVAEEPAWQAVSVLAREDGGATLSLVELTLAGDGAEVADQFATFTDGLARCLERTGAELADAGVPVVDAGLVDLDGIGDTVFAMHATLVEQGGDVVAARHQSIVVVRDGAVLAAFVLDEVVGLPGWPADVPEPALDTADLGSIAALAGDHLNGRHAALAAPEAAAPAVSDARWWDDRVFYEVFVRSFADSDADGNGDLTGLIERLDHLNDGDPATTDDLGVTGLWLMPVTESPTYHGYDTTDYRTVESDYGTNADYRALVAAAHERGMVVLVDLMLNHTSTEHPWFVSSAQGPDSPYRDWYVWRADDPGETSSWGTQAWHERNGAYYLGLFWEGMPDLNLRNPEVTAELYDVADFWLEDMGADGFRLDAVRHLVEEDGSFDGGPATHAWLAAWADHIDAVAPDALTIGEVWDRTAVVAPYVTSGEVDLAFEFDLASAVLLAVDRGDPALLDRTLAEVLATYPAGQFATFLTNHDQERVMSRLGRDEAEARQAATVLLTLPGVPFVYYGEEIGMTGTKPDELIRTPMQWSSDAHAGFSTAPTWEAPNSDYREVNVAAQTDDPASLLSRYRALVALRGDHPSLSGGSLTAVGTNCDGVYAYLRGASDGSEHVLVVHNLAGAERRGCRLSLDSSELEPGTRTTTDLLTGDPASPVRVTADGGLDATAPTLAAHDSVVLLLGAG